MPATSRVEFGTTTDYGTLSSLDSSLVTTHSVTISSLTPSTMYHFRVISADCASHSTTSPDQTFTTLASRPGR